jgi:hypothetical protein
MNKISWHHDWLYLDKGESRDTDTSFDFWWADYDGFHIEILPTNIIKGNNDFATHEHRYVYLINRGVSIGHTSIPYDSVLRAKIQAKKWIDTANLFGTYLEGEPS